MDALRQDLRYAFRTLRRSPGFTTAAVLCLALGLGANAVVFGALNALFLRPLPFGEPERLVAIQEHWLERGALDDDISYPNFVSWTRDQAVFESAAAYYDASFNLATDELPEYVAGAVGGPDLFRTLGVMPVHGRAFLPEEGVPGRGDVVVISDALWERRFDRNPAVLGREVTLNGAPHTIVGVMPAGFHFPEEADLWIPLTLDPEQNRGNHFLQGIARLAPGVDMAAAQRALEPIAERLSEQHPGTNTALGVAVRPIRENLVQNEVRAILTIMLGAVGFVLLVACANVAGLLLARGTTRTREMSIRAALGAGRSRVVRQLLTESLLLAIAGGLLGLMLGSWGLTALDVSIPARLPYWIRFELDTAALPWLAAAVFSTALVFGTLPAFRAARADLLSGLREGERSGADAPRQRLRSVLAGVQLALSLVLAVGAGLMVRSALGLGRIDPGFDTSNLLTMRVIMTGERYRDVAARAAYLNGATRRLESLPGVVRAAAISDIPLSGARSNTAISPEGHTFETGRLPSAGYRSITAGYFDAMGIPLLAGRDFRPDEVAEGARVAIVNRTLVERYWPGEDGIGRRIARSGSDEWLEIVGVVPAVRQDDLGDVPALQVYFPYRRADFGGMALVVRTEVEPLALAAPVRAALRGIDPSLAQFGIESMQQVVTRSYWDLRLYAWLFAIFAAVALLLAAIGVYGVVAFGVARRRGEFGIRIALGASDGDVLRLVLRQGALLIAAGLAIGLLGAFALSRVLEGFLHEVSGTDPIAFGAAAGVLGMAALLACLVPARRAMNVPPAEALRSN